MAEALKTFREGEDILASETNENNQFLLSKLTDNAAQVQSYVEGEVETIKSNVASVQATLQENINELENRLSNKLNSIFTAIAPNYNKGQKLSEKTIFTVPAYGWIYWTGDINQGPVYLSINGVNRLSAGALSSEDHINVVIPIWVEPGDSVSIPAGSNKYIGTFFYPCKGFGGK